MSIEVPSAESFAKTFVHYHEALAPDFNCAGEASIQCWDDMPTNERSRLIAAVRLALLDAASRSTETQSNDERSWGKPGEKEWGC